MCFRARLALPGWGKETGQIHSRFLMGGSSWVVLLREAYRENRYRLRGFCGGQKVWRRGLANDQFYMGQWGVFNGSMLIV